MNLINFIADHWEALAAIVGWITHSLISWGKFSAKISDLEGKIKDVQDKVLKYDPVFLQVQIDITAIKTTLEFIKEQLKANSHRMSLQ